VDEGGVEVFGAEIREGGFEVVELGFGLAGFVVVGGGEVGGEAFEVEVFRLLERLGDFVEGGAAAETAHAGVDLDVDFERGAEGVEVAETVEGVDDGGEVEVDEGLVFEGEDVAEDQDLGLEAGLAELGGLSGVGDGEDLGALLSEGAGDLGGAVAVGVGLDDGADGDCGGLGEEMVVGADLMEVDFDPVAVLHGELGVSD